MNDFKLKPIDCLFLALSIIAISIYCYGWLFYYKLTPETLNPLAHIMGIASTIAVVIGFWRYILGYGTWR
jgi:hypothetical protein